MSALYRRKYKRLLLLRGKQLDSFILSSFSLQPALHATALTFEAKMGYQMSVDYWDGIWGPDAVRQLQWCVSKPGKKEERSGPSRQWASWEGAVVYGVMLDWGDKVPDSIELDANKTLSVKGASMASVCVSEGWEDGEGAWITPIEGKAPQNILGLSAAAG